jgi:hypothetical protein
MAIKQHESESESAENKTGVQWKAVAAQMRNGRSAMRAI